MKYVLLLLLLPINIYAIDVKVNSNKLFIYEDNTTTEIIFATDTVLNDFIYSITNNIVKEYKCNLLQSEKYYKKYIHNYIENDNLTYFIENDNVVIHYKKFWWVKGDKYISLPIKYFKNNFVISI